METYNQICFDIDKMVDETDCHATTASKCVGGNDMAVALYVKY